jgi:hypothetical protein
MREANLNPQMRIVVGFDCAQCGLPVMRSNTPISNFLESLNPFPGDLGLRRRKGQEKISKRALTL